MRARTNSIFLVTVFALLTALISTANARAAVGDEEIPIERCDLLPVVPVKVSGLSMRFLLDTAATSILNLNSFSKGISKQIHVTSWSGTAATSAREVSLPELVVGGHTLKDLKLPAIDLSPISKACGGQIDGILGVDLLDRMGVTIDLKRRVATLATPEVNPAARVAEMEMAMEHCHAAFNLGRADELEDCFDPEIVLYTPWGEYRGRQQVMEYLKTRYLKFAPSLHYASKTRDMRVFGDALWYSYEYTIDAPNQHIAGRGMAMCRKQDGKWRMLNMHNSQQQPEPEAAR